MLSAGDTKWINTHALDKTRRVTLRGLEYYGRDNKCTNYIKDCEGIRCCEQRETHNPNT